MLNYCVTHKYTMVLRQKSNTEKEQLVTLVKQSEMLNSIPNIINNNLILGGDFNFFFDNLNSNWKSYLWRKKKSKKKSLAKLIEIKEALDLCNSQKVRNYLSTRFNFHQNHLSDRILDCFKGWCFSFLLQLSRVKGL